MTLIVKNLVFTVLVPGIVAIAIPLIIAGWPVAAVSWITAPASLLWSLGTALYLWSIWDFGKVGGGTPAPMDAPKRLVVRGPYRYTRNPMYIAVLMIILGWTCLFAKTILLIYLLGVTGCFHAFVVLYEEPHLKRIYGAEYNAYRTAVRRWLPLAPRRGKGQQAIR